MIHTIWTTGHPINEEVVRAFQVGSHFSSKHISQFCSSAPQLNPAVSYGFLRGTSQVFHECKQRGLNWWEIDRGYFKPKHYDGYYRISKCGLQATYNPDLNLPADRWARLNLPISPWKSKRQGQILLCPPTQAVCDFYGIEHDAWVAREVERIRVVTDRPIKVREKIAAHNLSLEDEIANSWAVVGFNTSALWHALRLGIPALPRTKHTCLSAWLGEYCLPEYLEQTDLLMQDRSPLFHFLAYCQFTLDEMRSGKAWRLCKEIQDGRDTGITQASLKPVNAG